MNAASVILLFLLVTSSVSATYGWSYERPDGSVHIVDRTENSLTDGNASVGLGVASWMYDKAPTEYGNSDCVRLNMTATANSRTGIAYTSSWIDYRWYPENELRCRVDRTNVGDDVIVPVNIPLDEGFTACRFYGGYGSAEYKQVYVSTNGFLSFDSGVEPSPTPQEFPCSEKPNAVIAALWTDLKIDSQASLITGIYVWGSFPYFVVIWKDALHKASQQRLTFEIIIGNIREYPLQTRFSQSQIWISYNTVSNINGDFAYGIEDQQGSKGDGVLCAGSGLGTLNHCTRWFRQVSNSFYLKKFTIGFSDTNPDSQFNVREEANLTRGHNIEWDETEPGEPDANYMFIEAIAGWSTLLIGAFCPEYLVVIRTGAFIIDTFFVTMDTFEAIQTMAYNQRSGRQVVVNDYEDGLMHQASVVALTAYECVDASVCLTVDWILRTSNPTGSHHMTVVAAIEYDEYSILDAHVTEHSISTEATLEIGPDDNNSIDKAYALEDSVTNNNLYLGGYDQVDYYNISIADDRAIRIEAEATPHSAGDNYPNFYLSLLSPSGNQVASSGPGSSQSLSYVIDGGGEWTIEVKSSDHLGFYCLTATTYEMGDLNRDGRVNILDIVTVAVWFGFTVPPAPFEADIFSPDGIIDIFDLVSIAIHFGETYSYGQGLASLPGPMMPKMLLGQSATISITPSQITVYKHRIFSVNVTVTDATSMYGWEFQTYWNNSVLNLTSAQILAPEIWGQDVFEVGDGVQNDFNETHGRYWKAMSALNPAPAFDGNVTIATLTFEALTSGNTLLDLDGVNLADDHEPYPETIPCTDLDSLVTVLPPTLYMRSDQHTINNATMYKLMETHTGNSNSTSTSFTDPENEAVCYWGVRVWKRSSSGIETEITSGSPVAVVSRASSGQGTQSASWNCPATTLNATDCLIVRVYYRHDSGAYTQCAQFSSVQLNATSLLGQTWTIYYYTKRSYNSQTHKTTMRYFWDSTYDSRIENVDYG